MPSPTTRATGRTARAEAIKRRAKRAEAIVFAGEVFKFQCPTVPDLRLIYPDKIRQKISSAGHTSHSQRCALRPSPRRFPLCVPALAACFPRAFRLICARSASCAPSCHPHFRRACPPHFRPCAAPPLLRRRVPLRQLHRQQKPRGVQAPPQRHPLQELVVRGTHPRMHSTPTLGRPLPARL